MEAADAFIGLLKSVDQAVNGKRTLRWRLGPLLLECDGQPTVESSEDTSAKVAATLVRGVESMEHYSKVPAEFSDEALEQARALGNLRGRGGIANVFIASPNGHEPTPYTTPVTQRVAATVDDVLGGKYRAIGSVEGRLERINIHGRHYFNVYEVVHGKPVKCVFTPEALEDARNALGERVLVTGEVTSNSRGHPIAVKVTSPLRILRRRTALPSLDDLLRIQGSMTGGMESTRFVQERWDDSSES